jgi:hypothetical protein
MDDQEAAAAREELTTWLREVLTVRYPAMVTSSSAWRPCWYRHPDVVEELSWLYAAWRAAYEEPDAPPTRAADWHDRWLPGVIARITEALRRCGHGSPQGGQAQDQGHKPREYAELFADQGLDEWLADATANP